MIIVAQQNNIRQAPRKVRLVANQVKKLPLDQAIAQLAVMQRRSSEVILQVIRQAIANAANGHAGVQASDLQLQDIVVSDGAILRRMRAVSRGRGHGIDKRMCHVRVVLSTKPTQEVVPETTPDKQVAQQETKKERKN